MIARLGSVACAMALLTGTPALAQSNPPSSQALKNPGCSQQASTAEPATKPAPKSDDGTSPGNAGSTGWSGGTGGSYIGTNPAGATKNSKTWQPATARGLDPIAAPVPVAVRC